MTYRVRIETDENGDQFFILPPELVKEFDFQAGDELVWTITDTEVSFRKADQ